jgi:hypothetical protein
VRKKKELDPRWRGRESKHTLLRFLLFPKAFARSAFTAPNSRTRSPTFVIPNSFNTAWSHSNRVSPVILFPVNFCQSLSSSTLLYQRRWVTGEAKRSEAIRREAPNSLSKTPSYFAQPILLSHSTTFLSSQDLNSISYRAFSPTHRSYPTYLISSAKAPGPSENSEFVGEGWVNIEFAVAGGGAE